MSGSLFTAWLQGLIDLKNFIEPSGYEILQTIIHQIKDFDQAIAANDLSALEYLYLDTAEKAYKLWPHIKDKKISSMWIKAAHGCVTLSKAITNGAKLDEVINYEQRESRNLVESED